MKFIRGNASVIKFVDSNVWLYALVANQDAHKEKTARKLTRSKNIAVSVKVVNEVCVNLIKKHNFDEAQIQKLIRSFFGRHQVIEIDRNILLNASTLRDKHSFSFWDSLIVSAALAANATTLYTEDMHDGLIVENKLKIVNPF